MSLRGALQTIFRLAPWPTETGLRRVGEPGRQSPVLVTCNYDLTVRRLMEALAGHDVWVVVAPSAGVNVWCAAAGGHFGSHQVVTALKTSGIESRVDHRRAILPQLAATGVERREVKRRCGWNAVFGPVQAEDLPRYLEARGRKDESMRRVRFDAFERTEMAIAWGGPAVLLVGGITLALASRWALPAATLSLGLAFALFFFYEHLPEPRRWWFVGASTSFAALATWGLAAEPGAAAIGAGVGAMLALILTYDYSGSTPTEGGSHFEERRFEIRLDRDRCKGVYSCWEVCPEACFEMPDEAASVEMALAEPDRKGRPPIVLAHDDRCVRCGACVVQCPLDALAFESEDGERIDPDVIRTFKLNLLGTRTVAGEAPRPPRGAGL